MNDFLIYDCYRRGVLFTKLGKCAFIAICSDLGLTPRYGDAIGEQFLAVVLGLVVVEIIFESCLVGSFLLASLFVRGLWCSPTSAPTVIHSKTSVITTEYHT